MKTEHYSLVNHDETARFWRCAAHSTLPLSVNCTKVSVAAKSLCTIVEVAWHHQLSCSLTKYDITANETEGLSENVYVTLDVVASIPTTHLTLHFHCRNIYPCLEY